MRLTTKGRVAVSAMGDLAARRNRSPVSLATMSERQQVSVSYLEHLFGNLRRHGLVSATRGPGGGYRLGRDAAAISVADIVRAVESMDSDAPSGSMAARNEQRCTTPELWASLNKCMLEFLENVSLQSIVSDSARAAWDAEVQAQAASRSRLARRPGRPQPDRPMPVNSVFALGGRG
ncbi:Rrf2 family transcriptional regulator [Variovorax robiniae]|uniref:Rrf2 family transcriptional regulator n=1 Tax=Variovorax robiniae TaxID=1836199 RepID=A0ABU8X123_9BURK